MVYELIKKEKTYRDVNQGQVTGSVGSLRVASEWFVGLGTGGRGIDHGSGGTRVRVVPSGIHVRTGTGWFAGRSMGLYGWPFPGTVRGMWHGSGGKMGRGLGRTWLVVDVAWYRSWGCDLYRVDAGRETYLGRSWAGTGQRYLAATVDGIEQCGMKELQELTLGWYQFVVTGCKRDRY